MKHYFFSSSHSFGTLLSISESCMYLRALVWALHCKGSFLHLLSTRHKIVIPLPADFSSDAHKIERLDSLQR